MERTVRFSILLILLIMVCGCTDNKITGQVTMDLTSNVIKNADRSTIEISGKNTGNLPVMVTLNIIPEDSQKLIISYPGNLDFTLQPNEDTGTKLVSVQGFTDYTSTRYWIKVQMINKDNGEMLSEKKEWLTVEK